MKNTQNGGYIQMKMNIVKQVDVNAIIDSKDMGVALAVAAQDEQISFIEAMVKEFKSMYEVLEEASKNM